MFVSHLDESLIARDTFGDGGDRVVTFPTFVARSRERTERNDPPWAADVWELAAEHNATARNLRVSVWVTCSHDVGAHAWSALVTPIGYGPETRVCGEAAERIAVVTGAVEALSNYLHTHHDPALRDVYEAYLDWCRGTPGELDLTLREAYQLVLDSAFDTYATRDFAPVRDLCPGFEGMGADEQGRWLAEHVGGKVYEAFVDMEKDLRRPYAEGSESIDVDESFDVGDYFGRQTFLDTRPPVR